MAKRFTSTDKWGDPWFRKLPNEYKCLWDYICCGCDIAGIWKVDFDLVNFCLCNSDITSEKALELFNNGKERIRVLNSGSSWLVVDFVFFQYGKLGEANRVHVAVKNKLKAFGIELEERQDPEPEVQLELVTPQPAAKDKQKQAVSKELSTHQKFVENFAGIYTKMSGQPFKADKKHFIIAAKLIEKYGVDEVEKKAMILCHYCQKAEVWFAKNGVADFTIEKLSSQWNSLIPQIRKDEREVKDEKLSESIRKLRERDERISR